MKLNEHLLMEAFENLESNYDILDDCASRIQRYIDNNIQRWKKATIKGYPILFGVGFHPDTNSVIISATIESEEPVDDNLMKSIAIKYFNKNVIDKVVYGYYEDSLGRGDYEFGYVLDELDGFNVKLEVFSGYPQKKIVIKLV